MCDRKVPYLAQNDEKDGQLRIYHRKVPYLAQNTKNMCNYESSKYHKIDSSFLNLDIGTLALGLRDRNYASIFFLHQKGEVFSETIRIS